VKSASAQVTITLLENNITGAGQPDVNVNAAAGTFSLPLLGGNIDFKSTNPTEFYTTQTAGSGTLPLGVTHVRISSGQGLTLLGTIQPEQVVSIQPKTLYAGGLNLGTGTYNINYRLAIAGTAWVAGTYYTPTDITLTTPRAQSITINVPSFMTINTPAPTTILTVASLSNYRTGSGISGTNTFNYSTSLPTLVSLQADGTSTFSFSTTTPKIVDPTPASNLLSAAISSPVTSAAINVTNVAQQLNATGIAVPVTNRQSVGTTFSVSPANLKANFVQAGTYNLPIRYNLAKTAAAYSSGTITATTTSNVQVVVPRLLELLVQTNDIVFNVNSINAYKNGLTVAMPNPVVLSSTVPYSLSVRASGDFTLSAGNTIPVGAVTIEGAAGQTGVTSLPLTNTLQTIISGASPQIDRSINLQYRIPEAASNALIGKSSGTYQNTITFTLTAP